MPIQAANTIGWEQEAMAPVTGAQNAANQNTLATVQKVSAIEEQRDKWAVERVLSVYNAAEPELQDNLRMQIMSNPQMVQKISKYGDPNILLAPTKRTGMERQVDQGKIAALMQTQEADLLESPDAVRGGVAKERNRLAIENDPSLTEGEDAAAQEEMQRKLKMESLLQNDPAYRELVQDKAIQAAQVQAEAQRAVVQQEAETKRIMEDETTYVYSQDDNGKRQYTTRATALKNGWKVMSPTFDAPTSALRASKALDTFKKDYAEFTISDPRSLKNLASYKNGTEQYRTIRAGKVVKLAQPFLYGISQAAEPVQEDFKQNFEDLKRVIEEPELRNQGTSWKQKQEVLRKTYPLLYEIVKFLPEGENEAEEKASQQLYDAVQKQYDLYFGE